MINDRNWLKKYWRPLSAIAGAFTLATYLLCDLVSEKGVIKKLDNLDKARKERVERIIAERKESDERTERERKDLNVLVTNLVAQAEQIDGAQGLGESEKKFLASYLVQGADPMDPNSISIDNLSLYVRDYGPPDASIEIGRNEYFVSKGRLRDCSRAIESIKEMKEGRAKYKALIEANDKPK